MKPVKISLGLAAGAALLLAGPGDSQAHPKSGYKHVTAESRYGNGLVTAPVRKAQFGNEVRLPGGLWYYCEVSCSDTLRRESLDFWETRSEESGGGRH